jgi:cold shock CspA family protein
MISIDDPVASVHYNLDSNRKTAHKIMAGPALAGFETLSEKVREVRLKRANGDETAVSSASGAGFGTVTSSSNRIIVNGQSSSGASVNTFSVARDLNPVVVAGVPGVSMATATGFSYGHGEGAVNMESLGNQTIEGVLAEGQRVTFTIEAGKIGNERPIVTVNERWYSQELQTVIFSKNSDPRMGETIYKLINIDRSEPDPSLFQLPADYTVEEGPGFNIRSMPPEMPAIQKRRRPNEN